MILYIATPHILIIIASLPTSKLHNLARLAGRIVPGRPLRLVELGCRGIVSAQGRD